jgi:hypothetical protein
MFAVDGIVVMASAKVDSVLSERMQTGLNYESNWCKEANLKINLNKTVVIQRRDWYVMEPETGNAAIDLIVWRHEAAAVLQKVSVMKSAPTITLEAMLD